MNPKLIAILLALSVASVSAHELSARAYVGTGDNVLIGGVIVEDRDCPQNDRGDRESVTFVIRVLGPSLVKAGVPNVLLDPVLAFYDSNGNYIGGQSNYTEVDIATQQAIYDHGLAPIDAHEVVLVVKLLPGAYTAVVTGANGTTGNAILEAYKL